MALTIVQIIQGGFIFLLSMIAILLILITKRCIRIQQKASCKNHKLSIENRTLREKISLAKTFIENHHKETNLRNNIIKRLTLKDEG